MSYTFRWAHPASEVYVTGTFDNWGKTVKLDRDGGLFEKTVSLPETKEKILYKFVADGEWKHDHTAKTDTDFEGNVNNVLYPTDLSSSTAGAAISSVAPDATTASLAGKQAYTSQAPPGAFPETPAPNDEQTFSVNPIPASEGSRNPIQLAPGEKVPEASTFNNNTITSGVHDDPELVGRDAEQTFGVAPIPATGGIGNPIHLEPGEKVPDASTLTGNSINSNVKLDKESYEKSDTGAPVLPPALSPQSEKEAFGGASIFGLGAAAAGATMIPESSLPMGEKATADITNPTVHSVGPTSTTNELAAQQPLESRGVPEIVGESQKEAHVAPEASANPEAVADKSEVESELLSKVPTEPAVTESGVASTGAATSTDPEDISAAAAPVEVKEEKKDVQEELKERVPEAPATSESGLLGKSEGGLSGAAYGGIAAAGTAAAGAAYALREKSKETTGTDPVSYLPQTAQEKINESTLPQQTAVGEPVTVPAETSAETTTQSVPEEVIQSQKEARVDPEASANPEAVKEKSAVEQELLSSVNTTNETGAPAPVSSAAFTESAPQPTSSSGAPQLSNTVGAGFAPVSLGKSSDGLNASADSPALPTHDESDRLAPRVEHSRDVSPMTKVDSPNQPTVTTGVASASAPTETKAIPREQRPANSTPQKRGSFVDRLKGTPESSKSDDSKKDKRRSLFGRLKDKMKN